MATGSDSAPVSLSANRFLLAGTVVLCALGALAYFVVDPAKISIFPPCYFHQITGWDCPGCGAQRALHQLLHGHLIAALRLNAMFVLSLPLAAWYGPRLFMRSLQGQTTGPIPRWLWFYLAAWIIFAIVRDLPFPVCQWFAA